MFLLQSLSNIGDGHMFIDIRNSKSGVEGDFTVRYGESGEEERRKHEESRGRGGQQIRILLFPDTRRHCRNGWWLLAVRM